MDENLKFKLEVAKVVINILNRLCEKYYNSQIWNLNKDDNKYQEKINKIFENFKFLNIQTSKDLNISLER